MVWLVVAHMVMLVEAHMVWWDIAHMVRLVVAHMVWLVVAHIGLGAVSGRHAGLGRAAQY